MKAMIAHQYFPQNSLVQMRARVMVGSFWPVFPRRTESCGTRKVRKTNIKTTAEAKTTEG